MSGFERLDAYKAAHELAVAVHRATKSPPAPAGDTVLEDLNYSAYRVPALIARGWGVRERKLYGKCLDQAAGYVSEIGYSLRLAKETGALPPGTCGQLDALLGRTRFYVIKLLLEIVGGPREEKG